MANFKTFDQGLSYINLELVRRIAGNEEFPNISYIHFVGHEHGYRVDLPVSELMRILSDAKPQEGAKVKRSPRKKPVMSEHDLERWLERG